jgi:hypothetical protein
MDRCRLQSHWTSLITDLVILLLLLLLLYTVFSRVGSEIRALTAANIRYTLTPGISSALAAPLSAGKSCFQ